MRDGEDRLDALVSAVANNERVDWEAAAMLAASPDQDVVRQLRAISALGAVRRSDLEAEPSTPARSEPTSVIEDVMVTAASAKLALAAVGASASLAGALVLPWAVPINVLVFGATGAWLFVRGGRDARVRSLAGLFLVIASAFANPLLVPVGPLALAGAAMRHVPTDAFLGVALWSFVRAFPRVSERPAPRLVADRFVDLATLVAVVLVAANIALASHVLSARLPAAYRWLSLLDRADPRRAYWPLLLLVSLPAIPYVMWKWRFDTVGDRRRVALFILGLVIGLTPMFAVVIASPFVPAFADSRWQRTVGLVVYTALLSIVPTTVYAVLVSRVMDLHRMARHAMQYALARYFVWFLTLAPPMYLLAAIYVDRNLTLTEFFGSRASQLLLIVSLLGVSAVTFRYRLLRAVDRWFLRDEADYTEALAHLELTLRGARTIHDIASAVRSEILRVAHAHDVTVLVAHDSGEFVPVAGGGAPLPGASALADLLRSAGTCVQLRRDDSPIVRTLPAADRDWLAETNADTLFPLVGATDTMLGAIALSPSRTGLPYTPQHRMVVTAMSGQIALRLENWCLRDGPVAASPVARRTPTLDWQNEPATYCRTCFSVGQPRTRQCPCGGATLDATLPLVLNGKFRLERLLGQGGMGVVYLAVDLTLDRRVAIKTLPVMSTAHSLRLQREAKAMASVLHPNLALIFGTEEWRHMPMIVVEYLEGRTLAARLQRRPLDWLETLDLGIVLADVLDRVHSAGVLHRDVKPSNIGYTRDGVPKLLDFGLAAALGRAWDVDGARPPESVGAALDLLDDWTDSPAVTLSRGRCLVGTPLYLAPEALQGCAPQPSFDLWALNLTLFEAIAGRHPFADERTATVVDRIRRHRVADLREFRPDCPSELVEFFALALSPELVRRSATAADLRNQLRLLRTGLDRDGR